MAASSGRGPRGRRPGFQPALEREIADLETVRVIADPLRFRIIQAMGTRPLEPWTAKEIARALAEPLTKLYYHLGLLEQHGLVAVAGTRIVSGIVEKRYQLAAERLSIARGLLAPADSEAGDALEAILATVFDTARNDIRAAVKAGIARPSSAAEAGDGREPVFLSHALDRMSPARAARFRERLRALCEELGHDASEGEATATDETRAYGLVAAFYPTVEPHQAKARRTGGRRTEEGSR